MKQIKNRFSESLYSKMIKEETDMQIHARQVEDLKYLKDVTHQGKLTPALYDFINQDGSMDNMMTGLPRPVEGVSCEALVPSQEEYIDAMIATEEFVQRGLISRMWYAFANWLEEFFNRNAFVLRKIRRLKALFDANTYKYFGDVATFRTTVVTMYEHTDWDHMVHAASSLNNACKSIPSDTSKLDGWLSINKGIIDTHLSVFGKRLDESNNIIEGSVQFMVQNNTCETMGWQLGQMFNEFNTVIGAMESEIAARRSFNELKKLYSASDGDARTLSTIKKIVIASKKCSLFVGKRFVSFMNQVMNSRTRSYLMNGQYRPNSMTY